MTFVTHLPPERDPRRNVTAPHARAHDRLQESAGMGRGQLLRSPTVRYHGTWQGARLGEMAPRSRVREPLRVCTRWRTDRPDRGGRVVAEVRKERAGSNGSSTANAHTLSRHPPRPTRDGLVARPNRGRGARPSRWAITIADRLPAPLSARRGSARGPIHAARRGYVWVSGGWRRTGGSAPARIRWRGPAAADSTRTRAPRICWRPAAQGRSLSLLRARQHRPARYGYWQYYMTLLTGPSRSSRSAPPD